MRWRNSIAYLSQNSRFTQPRRQESNLLRRFWRPLPLHSASPDQSSRRSIAGKIYFALVTGLTKDLRSSPESSALSVLVRPVGLQAAGQHESRTESGHLRGIAASHGTTVARLSRELLALVRDWHRHQYTSGFRVASDLMPRFFSSSLTHDLLMSGTSMEPSGCSRSSGYCL